MVVQCFECDDEGALSKYGECVERGKGGGKRAGNLHTVHILL